MIVDVHCHYTLSAAPFSTEDRFSFERDGKANTPTAFDSCLSPRALNRITFRLTRQLLGFSGIGPTLDTKLEKHFLTRLNTDGPIDRYVLLAFDAVFDDNGECVALPTRRGDFGSDIYASNTFIRNVCRQHADRFLFGASVHPYRHDALQALEEVFENGACLIKWMPLHHNIDPEDDRTIAAFRKCHELGLPILLHYGPEFMLKTNQSAFGELTSLLPVLEKLHAKNAMPTVIIAHAATPVSMFGPWRHYRCLLDALRGDFKDAPLYADISALATWGKWPLLRQLAKMQDIHHKLLFGTDFPVPTALPLLRRLYGKGLCRYDSDAQNVVGILRNVGFNEIVFHRAATLLPNVKNVAAKYFEPK